MPRPSENREPVTGKLKPKDRELLKQKVINAGYYRIYRGEKLPAWTEFMEAIAQGDIILHKKL